MSFSDTINYLYDLQKFGTKFGLENINRLMIAFENPHEKFLSIHVAGTNGKGSTSSILSSVLYASGLRVGLFTSPHLVSFTERIRINGQEITEKEVIELADEIRKTAEDIENLNPTFFEVVTTMSMLYFERKLVDIAVIETGMGGRLDATNIIMPEISVITNINYDHMEFLGNTLRDIAREKAGIIKQGVPVISANQRHDVEDVIRSVAEEKQSQLFIYGKDFEGVLKSSDYSKISFDYRDHSTTISDLLLPIPGEHQLVNASVAIKAAMILSKNPKLRTSRCDHLLLSEKQCATGHITEYSVCEGLKNLSWQGRLEMINGDPPVLIDGAHNAAAAEALSQSIKNIFQNKFHNIILVLGIMGDKDIRGIMEPLLPLSSETIFTAPAYTRAASPEKLKEIAESLGFSKKIRIVRTVREAIEKAKILSLTLNKALILITGSFYTIGEAKEAIGSKGVLAKLRE